MLIKDHNRAIGFCYVGIEMVERESTLPAHEMARSRRIRPIHFVQVPSDLSSLPRTNITPNKSLTRQFSSFLGELQAGVMR